MIFLDFQPGKLVLIQQAFSPEKETGDMPVSLYIENLFSLQVCTGFSRDVSLCEVNRDMLTSLYFQNFFARQVCTECTAPPRCQEGPMVAVRCRFGPAGSCVTAFCSTHDDDLWRMSYLSNSPFSNLPNEKIMTRSRFQMQSRQQDTYL